MHRVSRCLLVVVSVLCAPSVVFAGVTPALREQAEAVCRDDALRLCPEAVPDETAIIACMRPKRSDLTLPCRKVFDQVVRAVNR